MGHLFQKHVFYNVRAIRLTDGKLNFMFYCIDWNLTYLVLIICHHTAKVLIINLTYLTQTHKQCGRKNVTER